MPPRPRPEPNGLLRREGAARLGDPPPDPRDKGGLPLPTLSAPDKHAIAEAKKILDQRPPAGQVQQDRLRPYLVIRSTLGDRGVRPPATALDWFQCADVAVVAGDHRAFVGSSLSAAGLTSATEIAPGNVYTIFARVWNLGRLPASSVALRAFVASPQDYFRNYPPADANAVAERQAKWAQHDLCSYAGGTFVALSGRADPTRCAALSPVATWTAPPVVPWHWVPVPVRKREPFVRAAYSFVVQAACALDPAPFEPDVTHASAPAPTVLDPTSNRHVGRRDVYAKVGLIP